jgi:hypothetical protein
MRFCKSGGVLPVVSQRQQSRLLRRSRQSVVPLYRRSELFLKINSFLEANLRNAFQIETDVLLNLILVLVADDQNKVLLFQISSPV